MSEKMSQYRKLAQPRFSPVMGPGCCSLCDARSTHKSHQIRYKIYFDVCGVPHIFSHFFQNARRSSARVEALAWVRVGVRVSARMGRRPLAI